VVHRQQMKVLGREFPAATSADPGMNPQGLLSVPFHALVKGLAGPGHNTIQILFAPLLTA